MRWSDANAVIERLRADTRLYLPALSQRRGFSSDRVEHLLNGLVGIMPPSECYLEIGVLEGRTLEAASAGNSDKMLVGVDPCEKYAVEPKGFAPNVLFLRQRWQYMHILPLGRPVGVIFYDGDHSAQETYSFMKSIPQQVQMAPEVVLVLDDWDRATVREGAFNVLTLPDNRWRLLREMPCYGDGVTCPQQSFGYSFGVSVWGWK